MYSSAAFPSDRGSAVARARQTVLRSIVPVGAVAALGIAAAAGLGSQPGMLAWAALAGWSSLVAAVLLAVRRYDLRIFAVAHALFAVGSGQFAPAASVVAIIPMAALAVTLILSVMGISRSFVLTVVAIHLLYASAVLLVSVDPLAISAIVVSIAASAIAWRLVGSVLGEIFEGERTYRELFDRVPVGLYRTSLDGIILDANEALATVFGIPREELIGSDVRGLVEDPAGVDQLRSRVVEEGGAAVLEYRGMLPDGSVRQFRDRSSATVDASGVVVGFEGEIQDVTDQVSHVEALEGLVVSKAELIAAVSHELRTPLTSVVGFLDVLDGNPPVPDAERGEIIALAADQARDLATIVEDLLTAASIDNDGLVVLAEPVDVRLAVDAALRSLRLQASSEVLIELPPGTVALGDPSRVRQILRNLVGNALRYGAPPVTVREGERSGPTVVVEVADRGSGVPPEIEDRLFDPFVSGADTSRRSGSMGLGLSVSRRLARLMGGDLLYECDRETCFSLVLPAVD